MYIYVGKLVIASSDYTYMTCSLFSQSQASTF